MLRCFPRKMYLYNLCKILLISQGSTSHSEKYSVHIHTPLANYDRSLTSTEFSVSKKAVVNTLPKKNYLMYKHANRIGVIKFLNAYDWSSCFLALDFNVPTEVMSWTILASMDKYILSKIQYAKQTKNAFYPTDKKKQERSKNQFFSAFLKSLTLSSKLAYSKSRSSYNTLA